MTPVLPDSRLHCHPRTPCTHVTALHVTSCALAGGGLRLRFSLEGDVSALRIPAPLDSPSHADNLWQHTCFEAFVSTAETQAYREFNFSPSGQWAAYAFDDYRQRDTDWQAPQAPAMHVHDTDSGFDLEVIIPAELLPFARSCTLHIGLTAVIEQVDGTLSYWALDHPGDRPDFHQRTGFTLHLAPHTDLP